MKDKAVVLHAVTANVAVAEHRRHYTGSSQLYALAAFTPTERDPDTQSMRDCVGFEELEA